jgi:hypothetical protein
VVDQSQALAKPRVAARPPAVGDPHRSRRWPLVVTLVVGLGVAFAPVAFQMFSRAPKGGDMINAFRPYMTERKITKFQADMREINAAVVESRQQLRPLLAQRAGLSTADVNKQYASYADFERRWRSIDDDMSDMLRTMHRDIGDYAAVDALPPFPLFPWFFVAPGLLIAGASAWGLIARRRGGSGRGATLALITLGVGLIAAPAVFQMFTRAPKGGHMINEFRPLMTRPKVQRIQGYFLVIGSGEGTIRAQMLPDLEQHGLTAAQLQAQLPKFHQFSADWASISNQMAPMIGAMSDNVENYQAVDALPPFPLFPYFFVLPGVLVIAFTVVARRKGSVPSPPSQGGTP